FFSSRRRHTRSDRDWSSDVCSSDLGASMQISVEFKLANAAIRLAPGITPPKIVSRILPQPTEEARAARARGTVVLEAVIRLDGKIGRASCRERVESSGGAGSVKRER